MILAATLLGVGLYFAALLAAHFWGMPGMAGAVLGVALLLWCC